MYVYFRHALLSFGREKDAERNMELICLCRCVSVYSMGCSVGSLEHLHHLFLPGRRRPVQGETFQSFYLLTWVYQQSSEFFVWNMLNVPFFLRSALQAGGGVRPDLYSCVQGLSHLHCRCLCRHIKIPVLTNEYIKMPFSWFQCPLQRKTKTNINLNSLPTVLNSSNMYWWSLLSVLKLT